MGGNGRVQPPSRVVRDQPDQAQGREPGVGVDPRPEGGAGEEGNKGRRIRALVFELLQFRIQFTELIAELPADSVHQVFTDILNE